MDEEQLLQFLQRIDELTLDQRPLFGKMNVRQMVCHCADFFRMAKGTKRANEYGKVDPEHIKLLARFGKTAPTPKGFGQVEGGGTKPTEFEKDKLILKDFIQEFSELSEDYDFAVHPYFGKLDHKRWTGLAIYHLNHHLRQFGV
ncbi:DinB family protein [Ulvibacterium sp.]|uniref:DinB family protein n=1 Tax=Ulvibacterium sp. TaxID=2665914 RepID=UPI003BA8E4CF